MKMDVVAGSGNDEFYTPESAIIPVEKYLPRGSRVWCPFDTEKSLFIKVLESRGHIVTATHISNDCDFFTCEVPDVDFIISNPPYSMKAEVFERLFEIGKPFAMLVGLVGLFESKRRFGIFSKNEFELMLFNKRISYFRSYEEQKPSLNPPFSSGYVCYGVLPKQIVFETI